MVEWNSGNGGHNNNEGTRMVVVTIVAIE